MEKNKERLVELLKDNEECSEFVSWEELESKTSFFLDKSEAEAKYKELMKKYE